MSVNNPDYGSDTKNIQSINSFRTTEVDVNGNEYDYVVGFFRKVMKDKNAAENFAQQIYQVSQISDVPVLEIIKTMEGQTGLNLSATLAYYLNTIRSNSTMLGVANKNKPNFYAGRTVLI